MIVEDIPRHAKNFEVKLLSDKNAQNVSFFMRSMKVKF